VDVSEFVEGSDGTWEAPMSLSLGRVSGAQATEARGSGNGHRGGGVSRSSNEVSNDHGAKGWQVVRA
jgi:hypothetical protein